MHLTIKATLCLLLCFNLAHAQYYVAAVNYNHVAVNDTIELVFTYSSNGDEIDVYNKMELEGLKVVSGANQRSRSAIMQEEGKAVTFKEISLTYKLSSDRPGFFTIPSTSLTTKGGKKYSTEPIAIEVSPAPYKKVPLSATTAVYEDDIDFGDNSVFVAGFAYKEIQKITSPYVLVTGWVYLPEKKKGMVADKVMRKIDALMAQRAGVKEIYRDLPKQLGRRYYAITDTAGIVPLLSSCYREAGAEVKFTTIIREPLKWSPEEEVYLFESERKQWELAFKAVEEVKQQHLEKEKRWIAYVTLKFKELNRMDAFTAFARDNGYRLTDSTRVPAESDNPFFEASSNYTITLSRPIEMDGQALYEAMHFLSNAARQEKYHGKFMGLAISKAM